MSKKIALFSMGIPDVTQGGSGIFNYLVPLELLNRGFHVKAFFRVNEWFIKNHCNDGYLEEIKRAGLDYHLVWEKNDAKLTINGLGLLKREHQFGVCRNTIDGLGEAINDYDGCISLDLGWALALSDVNLPSVRILGDPLPRRLAFSNKLSITSPSSWKNWVKMKLVEPSYYSCLRNGFGEKAVIGSFSPQHAKELRDRQINCRHFRWFTPVVVRVDSPRKSQMTLVALHVGSMFTTASKNMIHYWTHELFPTLASKLPFNIEIRFVGRVEQPLASSWKNIQLTFLGHLDCLETEFAKADVFLTPMKYPIGVRTRILTALSYGVPVVADESASLGLPELEDGKEIFYGSTPDEIAEILQSFFDNPAKLSEARTHAMHSWEKYYHPTKNIAMIINALNL